MEPKLAELIRILKYGKVEERSEAACEISRLPVEEIKECFHDLCLALRDSELWTESDNDPWGAYSEWTKTPVSCVAAALQKLNTPDSFLPLLESLHFQNTDLPKHYIKMALESIPLPKGDPQLEPAFMKAIQDPQNSKFVEDVFRTWITEGKSVEEIFSMLDSPVHEIKTAASIRIGEMRFKNKDRNQRKMVRELRKLLRRPDKPNPIGLLKNIWEHATAEEMVDALLTDFLGREEFKDDIPDYRLADVGTAFVMLGFWMGSNSGKAVSRMTEIINKVKYRLNDKDLRQWYASIIKITSKPDLSIVEGMIELYERSDAWGKDVLITDMQDIYRHEDLLIPFFEKHRDDPDSALGNTTTIGKRITAILRQRKKS